MKPIITKRLQIRNFLPGDWEDLLEMVCQYEASEYAVYDYQWPTSPEEIQQAAGLFASGDNWLAVCLNETGRLIGLITLDQAEKSERQEFNLGYLFNFIFHGKGYASEACRAVLYRAFIELQGDVVIAGTAAANGPSQRLLTRLGFQKTGEGTVSFWKDENGQPIEFTGFEYLLTREAWMSGEARRLAADSGITG